MQELRHEVYATKRDVKVAEALHTAAKKAYVKRLNRDRLLECHTKLQRKEQKIIRQEVRQEARENAQQDRQEQHDIAVWKALSDSDV